MSLVQEIIFSVHEDIHNIQCCMIKDIVFNLQSSILPNHNNYLSIANYFLLPYKFICYNNIISCIVWKRLQCYRD